MKFGER